MNSMYHQFHHHLPQASHLQSHPFQDHQFLQIYHHLLLTSDTCFSYSISHSTTISTTIKQSLIHKIFKDKNSKLKTVSILFSETVFS